MFHTIVMSLTIFAALWLLAGYIGFGLMKYYCLHVARNIIPSSSGWNGPGRGIAILIVLFGPFGLWTQLSQILDIRKEYGKEKVPIGFSF